jgi:hypothetical protein
MNSSISPRLERACQVAAALVDHQLNIRQRLNPAFNPAELWASVTHDARICVGTPLLRPGQGYYVDHRGQWLET